MKDKPYKSDFISSYTRRRRLHDYYSPQTYHIILKKAKPSIPFGLVRGNSAIPPDNPGCAYVEYNTLGKIILEEIQNFALSFPAFQVYQFMVMPDHAHILLRVKEKIPKHLGYYIGRLKSFISKRYSSKMGKDIISEMIFEKNYTDKIIWNTIKLSTIITYIRENPHRLLMRIQHPEFFQRKRKLNILGKVCEVYGNLFLLRNPDKKALIIHSSLVKMISKKFRGKPYIIL